MGGFIPTCHAQPSGEVVKKDRSMNLHVKGTGRQTPWACGPKGTIWWANVHAEVDDEIVIDNAKRIVDGATPQKQSTFFGGQYYSFVTREYLLNLLLFYYRDHGLFPTGAVCIVNQWVWDGFMHKSHAKWIPGWAWRFVTRRAELHQPGFWVQIPSILSIQKQDSTVDEARHG
jgi:hypothetical protein